MKNIKFKHKALIGSIGLAIFLFSLQCAMQFLQTYKFVGFIKKDQSSWVGLAETAQADYQSCQSDLDAARKARNEANSDILN